MVIRKIYLDMDGVLADFASGVRELCGIEPPPQDERWQPGDDDEMWAALRKVDRYYSRLKLMPGAKEMFDAVYGAYGDRCEILSGVPKPDKGMPTASDDKREWVRRLLSEDIVINTVRREDKGTFCTGRDCVLIDDLGTNVREWELAGGTGILHTDPALTLRVLRDLEKEGEDE